MANFVGTAARSSVNLAFSAQEFKANFDSFLDLAPGGAGGGAFPVVGESEYMDPGEAYKYGLQTLRNFKTDYNMGDVPDDLLKYVAGAGGGAGLDINNPAMSMLNTVVSQVSSADFLTHVGPNLKNAIEGVGSDAVGFVTPELLKGGFEQYGSTALSAASSAITKKMGQGVGTAVGGAVGGAIGGIFGPIGAAVGGLLGSLFGSLFNPAPKTELPGDFEKHYQMLEAHQRLLDQMLQERQGFVASCEDLEEQYWQKFDEFFYTFGVEWMKFEQEIGFKFDLRWFEDTEGPAYFQTISGIKRMGARAGLEYNPNRTHFGTNQGNYKTYIRNAGPVEFPMTKCLLPMMGCPYPSTGVARLPSPGTQPFGRLGQYKLPNGAREAQVLAARELIWLPENERLSCEAFIPHPTSREYNKGTAGAEKYGAMLNAKAKEFESKKAAYVAGTTYLISDLSRTATAMKTYLKTMARRQEYRANGVSLKHLREIEGQLDTKHNVLNNLAMYGGLGALAFALYRSVRK